MNCLICNSKTKYFFSKTYNEEPFKSMMNDIGKVHFYKCINCGFTVSKTHQELDKDKFKNLNSEFHHYLEKNITNISQPPYIDQATLINLLIKNNIIEDDIIDFAGGYGTLSKILNKYYKINLPVYDPYIKAAGEVNYISNNELRKYKTVFSSALFEHIFNRSDFDEINNLVDSEGVMIIFTLICENIPKDPDWFYIEPPVHTSFHTNMSMDILMKQWGYKASIYCYSARTWVLFKEVNNNLIEKINKVNKELQREYLIFKEGFVDYWKGF